jgi:hypothetical protein
MEIDFTRRETGRHAARLPSQRVHSRSMPIRVPPTPPAEPVRKQPNKKPRRWALIVVPAIAVVVLGVGAASLFLLPGSIGNADAGDCASFDRSNPRDPYSVVRCGSAQASLTVLQVIEGEGNCREVPGATRSTIDTEGNQHREICMGPKDADPLTSVNIAQVGDCLTGTTGQEMRVSCTSPDAHLQILKRVNNVSTTQVSTTCDGVPNASSVYSWTWDSDDGTGPGIASYQTDAVFCLGPISG